MEKPPDDLDNIVDIIEATEKKDPEFDEQPSLIKFVELVKESQEPNSAVGNSLSLAHSFVMTQVFFMKKSLEMVLPKQQYEMLQSKLVQFTFGDFEGNKGLSKPAVQYIMTHVTKLMEMVSIIVSENHNNNENQDQIDNLKEEINRLQEEMVMARQTDKELRDICDRRMEAIGNLQQDLEFKDELTERSKKETADNKELMEKVITKQQEELVEGDKAKLQVITLQTRMVETNDNNHHLLTELRKKTGQLEVLTTRVTGQLELKEKEIEDLKTNMEVTKGEKIKATQDEEYVSNIQNTLKIVEEEHVEKSNRLIQASQRIKELEELLLLNETTQDELSEMEKSVHQLRQEKEEAEQREVSHQVAQEELEAKLFEVTEEHKTTMQSLVERDELIQEMSLEMEKDNLSWQKVGETKAARQHASDQKEVEEARQMKVQPS